MGLIFLGLRSLTNEYTLNFIMLDCLWALKEVYIFSFLYETVNLCFASKYTFLLFKFRAETSFFFSSTTILFYMPILIFFLSTFSCWILAIIHPVCLRLNFWICKIDLILPILPSYCEVQCDYSVKHIEYIWEALK